MTASKFDTRATQAVDLAEKLRPHFAGLELAMVGIVLADLTGTWLAGHPADVRAGLMEMQARACLDLAEAEADRMAEHVA